MFNYGKWARLQDIVTGKIINVYSKNIQVIHYGKGLSFTVQQATKPKKKTVGYNKVNKNQGSRPDICRFIQPTPAISGFSRQKYIKVFFVLDARGDLNLNT